METEFESICLGRSFASEHFSSPMGEIIHLITHLKGIDPSCLLEEPLLTSHGLDLVDLGDIILEIEKAYGLVIPEEVPVESVSDLINFVYPILSFIHFLKAPSDSTHLIQEGGLAETNLLKLYE